MTVTLIPEDGTGLANANTFATADEATAYASARGITLPTGDELASLLIQAADFVTTYECRFQGSRANPAVQALSWPRVCVQMYDTDVLPTVVPQVIKTAQIQIAIQANNGIDLFPSQSEAMVISEAIGPLKVEYQANTWTPSDVPVFSNVETTLCPVFEQSCSGPIWTTVRV